MARNDTTPPADPAVAGVPGAAGGRSRLALAVAAACWLAAAAVGVAWLAERWADPAFWPIHLLLYGPRWAPAVPLVILAPLAAWRRSRAAWAGLAAAGLAALGFSGVVIPGLAGAGGADRPGPGLRVLSCNVQGNELNKPALAALIRDARPDVVVLQECSIADPKEDLGLAGWFVRAERGLCVASRFPLADFAALRHPERAYRVIAVRARVERPDGAFPVVAVHLATPRSGLEPLLHGGPRGIGAFREALRVQAFESGLLRRWVAGAGDRAVLAGDFNMTSEHPLYRRDWSGHSDAFDGSSWGFGATKFTRYFGLRIDHILAGPGWRAARCWVGPDVDSDHRPVIADLAPAGR